MTVVVTDSVEYSVEEDSTTEILVQIVSDLIATTPPQNEAINMAEYDLYGINDTPAQDSSAVNKTWTEAVIAAAVFSDHNALANLDTGDYHTQYLNNARGDVRYAPIAHSNITSGNPHGTTASDISAVSLNGTETLTAKTIIDFTNTVYANQTHIKVVATEAIAIGDPLTFTSFDVSEGVPGVAICNSATDICFGLATAAIASGYTGRMTISGLLESINTSTISLTAGDWVYVNGDGILSPTRPTSGYMQPVALCLRVHATLGLLQVNCTYPVQDAADVRYDPSTSGLTAITTKTAIDELVSSFIKSNSTMTASGTIVLTKYIVYADATSGDITITLPTAVSKAGRVVSIKRVDTSSNIVTIATTSSETIDGMTGGNLDHYDHLRVISDGSNWLIIT